MKTRMSIFLMLVLVALSCKEDEEPRVNEMTLGDDLFKMNKIECVIFSSTKGFVISSFYNLLKPDQASCEISFWEIESGRVYPIEKTYTLDENFTDNIMVIIGTSDGEHISTSGKVTVAKRNGKPFFTFQDVVFKRLIDNTLWYGSAELGCDY